MVAPSELEDSGPSWTKGSQGAGFPAFWQMASLFGDAESICTFQSLMVAGITARVSAHVHPCTHSETKKLLEVQIPI